jgi:hypothetical protein
VAPIAAQSEFSSSMLRLPQWTASFTSGQAGDVAFWQKRTSRDVRSLVAIGGKADMAVTWVEVRVRPMAALMTGGAVSLAPHKIVGFGMVYL